MRESSTKMERHTEGACLGLRVKKAEKQPDRGWDGEKNVSEKKISMCKGQQVAKSRSSRRASVRGVWRKQRSTTVIICWRRRLGPGGSVLWAALLLSS